jgi:altronate hydrolase
VAGSPAKAAACGGGRALVLQKGDSVAVAVDELSPGPVEALGSAFGACVEAMERVGPGHKISLHDIAAGGAVIKYGRSIGIATRDVAAGSWVHEHNLRSDLCAAGSYGERVPAYEWTERGHAEALLARCPTSFEGYRRPDGAVGTRNELWVVPTVGCVNESARAFADMARVEFNLEAQELEHPFGCSQLGGDLDATRRILARLALHPNATAVLVVSLGCENNRLSDFKAELEALGSGGRYDPRRFVFLRLQDPGDEAEAARAALRILAPLVELERRSTLPLSELSLGLKCGGSDGFSGITANPLVGTLCDMAVAAGGRAIMTEVPEMFGAEEGLLSRSSSPEVFSSFVAMLQGFKDYYVSHGQEVYENPSPGNRDGGITTLEEKSLGCVRKAGSAPISAVLPYGGLASVRGLSALSAPGNDLVSSTALSAAGANLVLFTTGRGTPYGSVAPTFKIASNTDLARRKPLWIDFDAGRVVGGLSFDDLAVELLSEVVATASGRPTAAERGGHRGIAIFKDGVTL